MMFKNSLKLLCANFDKVWKLLVFELLSWAVVLGLLAPFYGTISTVILEAWKTFSLDSIFVSGTFYGLHVATALSSVCGAILKFFELLFIANIAIGIYFVVMLFIVRPFLSNVAKFVVCEMMYGYMASGSKVSFTGTMLRTLNRSLPYAGMKMLYSLPFNALILISLFGLTSIHHPIFDYIMPFMIVLVPALLLAFKETFTAGWAPAMIVFDVNVFRAFPKGMSAMFRRGLRVYSTAFVIFLLALILSMVLGLYALIIILPIIFPLLNIFEMVMFFSSQGMRFYVDADTILSPKKLEEVDRIEDAKYLL